MMKCNRNLMFYLGSGSEYSGEEDDEDLEEEDSDSGM
jgi:hypothetical protein